MRLCSVAVSSEGNPQPRPLLRRRVASVASLYFRRFYLRRSFADCDPRVVMPAALFLASKVEETRLLAGTLLHYSARLAAQGAGPPPPALQQLLKVELLILVSTGLLFDQVTLVWW